MNSSPVLLPVIPNVAPEFSTFIFRRVCRAFGVFERYVCFPDNLLIFPAAHCRYCAGLYYA
jgi:hypothetical protein